MTHRLLTGFFFTTSLVGCGPTYLAPSQTPIDSGSTMPADFSDQARSANVPAEILYAIARSETGFQMVAGSAEFDGQAPAFGLMALRGEQLQLAADLSGLDVEEVKTDRAANIMAAAELLGFYAEEMGIDTDELSAWAPVVARYSNITDAEAVAEYIHYDVYGALNEGIETEGYYLPPMAVVADWPLPAIDGVRGRDSSAVWSASPNYNSRNGAKVDYVIIHTCEGTYSGCWGWLVNPSAGVSAHYVVNESGSEVRALVDESNRAWHIGASYDCDNNYGRDCSKNGTSTNTISVGIEHAGYASQSSWNNGLLQRSAELTCGITQRNNVVRDSYHIVGHGQLQPWDRTDPGPNWPWTDYINRVKAACGDAGSNSGSNSGSGSTPTTGRQFVIDSNNSANDSSNYYIDVSGNWRSSTSVRGYYNTGYWVAPTEAISDGAKFMFRESATTCYKVEAWWTSATDRPTSVSFIGYNGSGSEVGRKSVNQQANGGMWNNLGTWRFTSGWNQVLLSRWTTAGKWAVADAVRLTPATCP